MSELVFFVSDRAAGLEAAEAARMAERARVDARVSSAQARASQGNSDRPLEFNPCKFVHDR